MRTSAGSLIVFCAVMAGQVLMPVGRLKAQNFRDWPVTRVAAGGGHSVFTRADGAVFVTGDNTYGQLGLGPAVANVNVPTALTNGVGLIAAGGDHTLLARGHQLWATGANWSGQLGDGTTNNRFLPELVVTLPSSFSTSYSFTALSAGGDHSLYAFANNRSPGGGFSVMGDNTYGELGDGTYINHLTPEQIVSWSLVQPAVTACAGGWTHSLFVKSDGSLWAMGDDYGGILGDGASSGRTNLPEKVESAGVASVAAGAFSSYFIEGGVLFGMGGFSGSILPTFIGTTQDLSAVTSVSSGSYTALFLLSDGTLWSMGEGTFGQLGVGYIDETNVPQFVTSNVVAIASGYQHSLFIKSDGSLWGMGYNADGELGTGDYNNRDIPVEIVAPPPEPVILAYGANAILAWPTNSTGFVLQSTTGLASPAWTAVSPGPVVVGNQFVAVFNTVSAPQRFFRLALGP